MLGSGRAWTGPREVLRGTVWNLPRSRVGRVNRWLLTLSISSPRGKVRHGLPPLLCKKSLTRRQELDWDTRRGKNFQGRTELRERRSGVNNCYLAYCPAGAEGVCGGEVKDGVGTDAERSLNGVLACGSRADNELRVLGKEMGDVENKREPAHAIGGVRKFPDKARRLNVQIPLLLWRQRHGGIRGTEGPDGRYQDEHSKQPDHNVALHKLSLSVLPPSVKV